MKFYTLLYHYIFLLIALFSQVCFSQTEIKESLLNQNVKELMNSNPEQAINITKLLLSKPSITDTEKAKINLLTAKIYKVKGDYNNSLHFLYEEEKFANYLTEEEKLTIELEKIAVLRELSLDKEAKDILKLIENSNEYSANIKLKELKDASVLLEKEKFLLKERNYTKGIELLQNEFQKSNSFKNFPELRLSSIITLGQLYLENQNSKQSKKYFEEALLTIKQNNNNNNYEKVIALSGLASIYFQEKKHNNAIALLKEAYNNSIGLQNTYLQELILKKLSVNYLAINDTLNYKLTNVNLIQKNVEIEKLDQDAINTAYNLISQSQSEKHIQQESNYYKISYIIFAMSFLFICVLLFLLWQIFQKKKRLKEIINYLNITRNNFISQINVREETKKINIPKETEELLLKKLEKFKNSTRFTNKDISLSVLAGQLDTNTKYLSEVINSNFNMNFNTYINKLRINYIVEKLRSENNFINYKISYLAENCGFSSHSSFATVFKSITGISPVTFIDLLRKEKESSTTDEQ